MAQAPIRRIRKVVEYTIQLPDDAPSLEEAIQDPVYYDQLDDFLLEPIQLTWEIVQDA